MHTDSTHRCRPFVTINVVLLLQLSHWTNPCVFLAFLSLLRQLKRMLSHETIRSIMMAPLLLGNRAETTQEARTSRKKIESSQNRVY